MTTLSPHSNHTVDLIVDETPTRVTEVVHRDPTLWLQLSIAAAVVAAIGNVVALLNVDRFYGAEAEVFVNQAIAQDLVNFVVVAPLMVALAWLAMRGSLTAFLLWFGFVGFTIYNYVIYTFAIHFGPLFLVWVAVLGASTYALIGAAFSLDANAVANAMHWRQHRVAAGLLMGAAVMFAMLWLSDIAPALQEGTAPAGVRELLLPTNPVHILDLAFFLPAAAIVGAALWQRRPLGYAAAPGILVLMALTGLPVLTTVFVAAARGMDAAWQLLGPIGLLTVACFALAGMVSREPRASSQ
jgi:hypothetical protein